MCHGIATLAFSPQDENLMYAHLSQTQGVRRQNVRYLFEEIPRLLDATIAFGPRDAMFKVLRKLGGDQHICYMMTVHLPVGYDMTDPDAIDMMRQALRHRGIEPNTVPYILARHAETGKPHFHMLFLDRTFTGRHLVVDQSSKATQTSHLRLSMAYGLPLPEYFDPEAIPTFSPPIIKRRVKHAPTAKKKRRAPGTTREAIKSKEALHSLNVDLLRVFREDQPTDLPGLNRALHRIGAKYCVALEEGQRAKQTYATTHAPPIFLNKLGPAWYVAPIKARMALAEHLIALRPILALRYLLRAPIINTTQDLPDDSHNPADFNTANRSTTAKGASGPDRKDVNPSHALADPFGKTDQWRRGELDRLVVPTTRRTDTGPTEDRATGRRTGPVVSRRDGGRLTRPNGWIARLCRAARKYGGRLRKIVRDKAGKRYALIHYNDGGVSIHSKTAQNIKLSSPHLAAFFAALTVANSPAIRRVEPVVPVLEPTTIAPVQDTGLGPGYDEEDDGPSM